MRPKPGDQTRLGAEPEMKDAAKTGVPRRTYGPQTRPQAPNVYETTHVRPKFEFRCTKKDTVRIVR